MDAKPFTDLIIDPTNLRIVSDFQGNNLTNAIRILLMTSGSHDDFILR